MCEVAGCGYEGMHVHFWGAVDVLIYDLRGKEELSPAGEKRHLLDRSHRLRSFHRIMLPSVKLNDAASLLMLKYLYPY